MNKLQKFPKRYEGFRVKTPIDFRWLRTFSLEFLPNLLLQFINKYRLYKRISISYYKCFVFAFSRAFASIFLFATQ